MPDDAAGSAAAHGLIRKPPESEVLQASTGSVQPTGPFHERWTKAQAHDLPNDAPLSSTPMFRASPLAFAFQHWPTPNHLSSWRSAE